MTPWQLQAPIAPQAAFDVVSRHASPEQQADCAEHDWPRAEHVAVWHVPLVAAPLRRQLVPAQQSALAVQTPPLGWQATCDAHLPPRQVFEQQSAELVQAPASFAVQVEPASVTGSLQMPMLQSPAQHASPAAHAEPSGLQEEPVQRRPPSAPGTHGRPPQH